jgi:hypothetical protein
LAVLTRPVKATEPKKGAQKMMAGPKTTPRMRPREVQEQVFQFVEVTGEDFRQLAIRRAEHVKGFLLETGKVDNERIFLATTSEGGIATNGSRAFIHLR